MSRESGPQSSTSRPVSPSRIESAGPPAVLKATVGVPCTPASTTTSPQPSLRLGIAWTHARDEQPVLLRLGHVAVEGDRALEPQSRDVLAQVGLPPAGADDVQVQTRHPLTQDGHRVEGDLHPLLGHQPTEDDDAGLG